MKNIVKLVAIVSLATSFIACSTTDNQSETITDGTYSGTVSAVTQSELTLTTSENQTVTIALSENSEFKRENMGGEAPEKPSDEPENGDAPQAPQNSENAPSSDKPQDENSEMMEQPDGEQRNEEVPEKPDGENSENEKPNEQTDGNPQNEQMPEENMATEALTYEDVHSGEEVSVVVENGVATQVTITSGQMLNQGPQNQMSGVDSYSAVNEYTEDTEVSNTTLTSNGKDENAVLVQSSGVNVTLDSVTVNRESSESTGGDTSSFYGVGAAALVTDGTLNISSSTIDTNAKGGAGVFAYGDGVAYVSDTNITTKQDTAGGIHVAGGGTLYAWDLSVETNGESSAAIRSDRGSGTMVVDGGTYTTNGTGSPAVYSTADITVNDATLIANNSEAICIEGLNTIRLFDCDVSGNMQDLEQNDGNTWNVILYQSMSGDSDVGNSTFEMVGGTLTAKNGGMFYTTNTESTFVLSQVDITYSSDQDYLLKCTGNNNARGWGEAGKNGADCHFTATKQDLVGNVIWDTISQLDFYLTDNSQLTGAFINDESDAGSGGSGYANVYIDENSTWIVTADSKVSTLSNIGTIVDDEGNTVSVVGEDGTKYVTGNSAYTITVSSYLTSVDLSNVGTLDTWNAYQIEKL